MGLVETVVIKGQTQNQTVIDLIYEKHDVRLSGDAERNVSFCPEAGRSVIQISSIQTVLAACSLHVHMDSPLSSPKNVWLPPIASNMHLHCWDDPKRTIITSEKFTVNPPVLAGLRDHNHL